jgi:hypothetical protein
MVFALSAAGAATSHEGVSGAETVEARKTHANSWISRSKRRYPAKLPGALIYRFTTASVVK